MMSSSLPQPGCGAEPQAAKAAAEIGAKAGLSCLVVLSVQLLVIVFPTLCVSLLANASTVSSISGLSYDALGIAAATAAVSLLVMRLLSNISPPSSLGLTTTTTIIIGTTQQPLQPLQQQQQLSTFAMFSLYLAHLILTMTLGLLAVFMAAQAVCDPLIRVVDLKTSPPLLLFSAHGSLRDNKPTTTTQTWLPFSIFRQRRHLFVEQVLSSHRHDQSCSVKETAYSMIGQRAVILFCSVCMGCFLVMMSMLRLAVGVFLFFRLPSFSEPQQPAALQVATLLAFVTAYLFAASAFFGIVVSNEEVWDWRPMYALLAAFATVAYLFVGTYTYHFHYYCCYHHGKGQGPKNNVMVAAILGATAVWLQIPLAVEEAVMQMLGA